MKRIGIVLGLWLCSTVLAQQSSSYKLHEQAINLGGNPRGGVVLTSASYRITLDAVGDAVGGVELSGTSYRVRGGFVGPYPPPGEVHGLRFASNQDLTWNPERSVGSYNVYHWASDVGDPGSCLQAGIATEAMTITHAPPSGVAYRYIVTAENLLEEEGPWGHGRIPAVSCP